MILIAVFKDRLKILGMSFMNIEMHKVNYRGIRTLDFSRKTTKAVLSDLQTIDLVK